MTTLETLAARSGIEAEFRDARGEMHRTTESTQRTLLAAMGVAAGNDAEISNALQDFDRAEWGRALPPVHVAYVEAGPVSIDLILPSGTGEITWQLVLEDGGVMSGQADFGTLTLNGQQQLDGRALERRKLAMTGAISWGYHQLTVQPSGAATTLIATPGRCWLPPAVGAGRRLWGLAAQLYLLRSGDNWGVGDFGDLRQLIEMLSDRGADVVGLNPLHAMFLDDPEHASPYSPASRLLLNVLNIDVANLPEIAGCEQAGKLIASTEFQRRLDACRGAALVDYSGVADLKQQVLRLLFDTCRTEPEADRWKAFDAFRRERGATLERSCLFEALRQHFAAQGHADWHTWPEEYQDPASPAVARFAEEQGELVSFRIWLQFLADDQLAAAAAAAEGMEVGLYRDLAVGADKSGAETWINQTAVVADAQVGAPPDIYNEAGQDWGLPPFHPRALREEAYSSFVQLVRANMRHAGGLRIDHVMALQHLYWVPKGQPPSEGAYVQYAMDDLIGILALESQRNQCLVVGEDLGTVPEGFRERMTAANILSYRVLFFEKDDTGFLPPDRYPSLALAVAGSHDLPTLRSWWQASDVDLKEELNLFPSPEGANQLREERARDREQLVTALRREGLIPTDGELDVELLIQTAHAYLGRSTSVLAMVQIDDITGEADPVNVPSTSNERPNWRRRLSLTLEELRGHPRLNAVAEVFAAERAAQPHQTNKK